MIHSKRGFTLVEIMIVVAIIGVILAIAVPNFVKSRESTQKMLIRKHMDFIQRILDVVWLDVGGSARKSDLEAYGLEDDIVIAGYSFGGTLYISGGKFTRYITVISKVGAAGGAAGQVEFNDNGLESWNIVDPNLQYLLGV